MAENIPVHQDLIFHGHSGALSEIRTALISHATPPWHYDPDQEDEATQLSSYESVIIFIRDAGDNIEPVALFLVQKDNRYEVTDIIPRNIDELTIQEYNSALQDFVLQVAEPASQNGTFRIDISSERLSIKDWIPDDAAEALHSFSVLANKSTGSAHLFDQKRWFKFIFAAYQAPKQLNTDLLKRWLVKVEGWSDKHAHDLALQYEFGLDLLKEYDMASPERETYR